MLMPLEDRVDTLETVLGHFMVSTDVALNRMERGLREFKDEMQKFKVEAELDRKYMNRRWGELANKMGTVVEDIVAPNIRGMAREYFKSGDLEFFGVRVMKRNAADRSLRREFDVIAVSDEYFIINETKSKPNEQHVREFVDLLGEIGQYFPEYADRKLIPVFASLYMTEEIVRFLTRNRIYAMTMKDDTMGLANFGDFEL